MNNNYSIKITIKNLVIITTYYFIHIMLYKKPSTRYYIYETFITEIISILKKTFYIWYQSYPILFFCKFSFFCK